LIAILVTITLIGIIVFTQIKETSDPVLIGQDQDSLPKDAIIPLDEDNPIRVPYSNRK